MFYKFQNHSKNPNLSKSLLQKCPILKNRPSSHPPSISRQPCDDDDKKTRTKTTKKSAQNEMNKKRKFYYCLKWHHFPLGHKWVNEVGEATQGCLQEVRRILRTMKMTFIN